MGVDLIPESTTVAKWQLGWLHFCVSCFNLVHVSDCRAEKFCNANFEGAVTAQFQWWHSSVPFCDCGLKLCQRGPADWLIRWELVRDWVQGSPVRKTWMVIGWTISKSLFYGDLFVSDIYLSTHALDHAEPTDVTWCDHCALNDPSLCARIRSQFSSYAVWNDPFYHSSISRGYIFGAHIALLSRIIFIIYICRC